VRGFHFLRTPIRGDHQSRLLDVEVAEAPLHGDPPPGAPYPQTLELSFAVDAAATAVEIAPLWEGELVFLADSTAGHPDDPADVSPAALGGWAVTGDLVLRTMAGSPGFEDAFAFHVPLVGRVPAIVRYSKVRLTEAFLFTTLRAAAPAALVFDGQIVDAADPLIHEKLVIAFLAGAAAMPCLQHPDDSGLDTAREPMPEVVLAATGRTLLRVSVASVSEQDDPAWFDQVPAYDDLAGELLADPALRTDADLRFNPAHPGHSAIPAWGLFQDAALAAYAPDHAVGVPVRVALTAPRPDGLTYRRLDLIRPPIPGPPVGSAPQRPYPQHKLCWTPTGGQPTESLRIPLSGRVYLPLADQEYMFWALPRSRDPSFDLPGEWFMLSVQPPPPARTIGLPDTTQAIDFSGAGSATLFAHLRPYDAAYVWDGYASVADRRGALMARAAADWNAKVFMWHTLPTTAAVSPSYAPLYAYLRESAGRHGLSPEFLQVVAFGEGINRTLEDGIVAGSVFDPLERIDAFGFCGLDLILYRVGGLMPDASTADPDDMMLPPIPGEIPPENVEERAEYTFNLVTAGYVDPATAATVVWSEEIERVENGTRTIQIATVDGWEAAIELIAAEVHSRLDEMVAYLAAKVPPVPVLDELQRRYLAYARFNSKPETARVHADELSTRLKKWPGAQPSNNRNVGFNTIQRIAVTQWHEAAGIYR
jgi:hypothetical protein